MHYIVLNHYVGEFYDTPVLDEALDYIKEAFAHENNDILVGDIELYEAETVEYKLKDVVVVKEKKTKKK